MRAIALFLAIMFMAVSCFASGGTSYMANASPLTVGVNTNTESVSITFPYTTRYLKVENYDSADYIWVDVKSPITTRTASNRYLVGPGDDIELYDFATDGISIIRDTLFSTGDTASPIAVMSAY